MFEKSLTKNKMFDNIKANKEFVVGKVVNMKHSILYKELAKHCGVTERYIRMIDSKERTPSMETAKKISDYLGESIEDVFFKDKSNKKFFLSKYKSKIINQNKEVS